MREAGMHAVGKHFPGHGAVTLDSHVAMPEDRRDYADIMDDLVPFERLAGRALAGVMMAHVVYSTLDPKPAGFSRWWIEEELRGRIGFRGVVFSDDLSMEGAAVAGDPPERARAALSAGCDMILVCNDRPAAVAVMDDLGDWSEPASQLRLAGLHGRRSPGYAALTASEGWRLARARVDAAVGAPALVLEG
jgi:beta-N-acetylhexosaminidase